MFIALPTMNRLVDIFCSVALGAGIFTPLRAIRRRAERLVSAA